MRLAAAMLLGALALWCADRLPRLRVSENQRFLVTERGEPFFWLGDTCWMLFEHSAREATDRQPSIDTYFTHRAANGFNVIQATFFFFPDRHDIFDKRFWQKADWLIDRAAHHGLYLALLPVWNVNLPEDHPLVQDPWEAYRYGLFLGQRYGNRTHIIWVMGGDPWRKGTGVDNPKRLTLNRAIAEGIADGTNGLNTYDHRAAWSSTLMTYHPHGGGRSSSEYLHDEPWLDFHMIQTGPGSDKYYPSFAKVADDYSLRPVKPALLAEPVYENAYKRSADRRYNAYDVRQAAYWAVFAGAFGHTYGGLEIWQLFHPGIQPLNKKITTGYWFDLLDLPGAMSLKHLRSLMESRPFLDRIPDQSLVINPGTGRDHVRTTRASDGSYAFVYVPTRRAIEIDLTKLAAKKIKAQWYSPRDGSWTPIDDGAQEFTPPSDKDWVLVLDRSE